MLYNAYITVSEYTSDGVDVPPCFRRKKNIILHRNHQWHMGNINNRNELNDFLKFFEITLEKIGESYNEYWGKTERFRPSKDIVEHGKGYWTLEQLQEFAAGRKLKKVKGMSNGSLVDCYIGIGENNIEVYRPNPNAKNVYIPMELKKSISYKKTNWII
jgi:hypothetical protein